MRKINIFANALVVLTIIIFTSSAFAVPNLINYQGKLTDPDGVALTGSYNLEFYLYTEKQGGSDLWNEQQTVQITEGIYNVQLGSIESFPSDLFDNDPIYLEVKIFSSSTGWETLSPRERITSTAFAINATSADMATDADTVDGFHGNELEESAEIDSKINDHTAISGAHHTKTTSFTELKDTATDAQIPDDITIDYAEKSGSADTAGNADTVDGKHAYEFLDTSSNTQTKLGGLNIGDKVGIGTTTPTQKLEIFEGNLKLGAPLGVGAESRIILQDENDYIYKIDQTDPATYEEIGIVMNDVSYFVLNGYGNVGIGTTDPLSKLNINGDLRIGLVTDDDGSTEGYGDRLYFSGGDDWNVWDSDNSDSLWIARYNVDSDCSELRINIGDNALDMRADKLLIGASDHGTPNWYPRMAVLGTGNVGIGTTDPQGPLHVDGGASPGGPGEDIILKAQDATSDMLTYAKDGGDILLLTGKGADGGNSGNVGIGTTDPLNKLNINGDLRIGLVTEDNGSTEGYGDKLYFSGGDDWNVWDSDNSDPLWIARYNVDSDCSELRINIGDNALDMRADKLLIGASDNKTSIWYPGMAVLGTGNVGIGTTDPQQKMHISGVMRLEPQSSPPSGALGDLYVGTDGKLYFHNGTQWKEVSLL